MVYSKRRELKNLFMQRLLEIDGGISPYNPDYTFRTNLFGNVFGLARFFDEINDITAIVIAGDENILYQTKGNAEGLLPLEIKVYTNEELTEEAVSNLTDDIEHIIYHMQNSANSTIIDFYLESAPLDNSIIDNYGIAQITAVLRYSLYE